jgi:Chalcone isomerase-like
MLKKILLHSVLLVLLIVSVLPLYSAASPTHLDKVMGSASLQGSGQLYWWGFHVYDASFYRAGSFASPEFALEIRYHKSFRGTSIANRSAEEMRKIGVPEPQATQWGKELASFLPDVESGQTLMAVYTPAQGTIFYHDGKRIAQVNGADFSKAFFGIWLDPKTSQPKLRRELLGQSCTPPLFNEVC